MLSLMLLGVFYLLASLGGGLYIGGTMGSGRQANRFVGASLCMVFSTLITQVGVDIGICHPVVVFVAVVSALALARELLAHAYCIFIEKIT